MRAGLSECSGHVKYMAWKWRPLRKAEQMVHGRLAANLEAELAGHARMIDDVHDPNGDRFRRLNSGVCGIQAKRHRMKNRGSMCAVKFWFELDRKPSCHFCGESNRHVVGGLATVACKAEFGMHG